jgi:hypothetical protein
MKFTYNDGGRKAAGYKGILIARVSKHYVAIINGVIHDLYDPSRQGTSCVYGYWQRG